MRKPHVECKWRTTNHEHRPDWWIQPGAVAATRGRHGARAPRPLARLPCPPLGSTTQRRRDRPRHMAAPAFAGLPPHPSRARSPCGIALATARGPPARAVRAAHAAGARLDGSATRPHPQQKLPPTKQREKHGAHPTPTSRPAAHRRRPSTHAVSRAGTRGSVRLHARTATRASRRGRPDRVPPPSPPPPPRIVSIPSAPPAATPWPPRPECFAV